MRCDQARERIGPLLDGELSDADIRVLAAHTDACPTCARFRDELNRLRGQLLQVRENAPHHLAQRVRARLRVEHAAMAEEHAAQTATWRTSAVAGLRRQWPVAMRRAAVLLVVCLASIAGTWWWLQSTDAQDALARDVLSAHVRSLLQENAVQIANSDMHTVKPWFAGRLDFTPVVKDLSQEGFQLIGGRLDYVGGRRVAAIVYRRRLHQVNVFVWPSADALRPASAKLNGYNLVSWSHGGMTFWAASDLNEGELRELQSLL
jgi:anti-sigma factor RsiW